MRYLGVEAARTAHDSMLSFALLNEDVGLALPQSREDYISPQHTSLYQFNDTIVTHAIRGRERLAPVGQFGYRLSHTMSTETPISALVERDAIDPEAFLGYEALRTVTTWGFTTPKKPAAGQELIKRSFGVKYVGVTGDGNTENRIEPARDHTSLLAKICHVALPKWTNDTYPLEVVTDELDITHIKHILANLGWMAIAR